MFGQITISLWVFLLLALISTIAILDRILIPSTRWFLRRRINRVIDDIQEYLLQLDLITRHWSQIFLELELGTDSVVGH